MEETRAQLETALGKLGYSLEDGHRFLVTHMHRDHYTLGVTVRRAFGTPVSVGIGEKPSLEAVLDGHQGGQLAQLERAGATELAELVCSAQQAGEIPALDGFELPDVWLESSEEIELMTWTLRAIHTLGHTRGHVVFLDAEFSLLFSGDYVLLHITPSIGLEPVGSLGARELPRFSGIDAGLSRRASAPCPRPSSGQGARTSPGASRSSRRAAGPGGAGSQQGGDYGL